MSDTCIISTTLLRETNRAQLHQTEDGEEVWIPKSLIEDQDTNWVEIPVWWAQKNGLYDGKDAL